MSPAIFALDALIQPMRYHNSIQIVVLILQMNLCNFFDMKA